MKAKFLRMYINEKWWNFKQGISNLFYYFKVIWKDQNFDYSYIDNLVLAKLKRVYSYMLSSCLTSIDNKEIRALKICIDILERKQKDFYYGTFEDLIDCKMSIDEMFIKENPTDQYFIMNPNWEISSDMNTYNKLKGMAESIEARDKIIFNKLFKMYKEQWWS